MVIFSNGNVISICFKFSLPRDIVNSGQAVCQISWTAGK
jgi:hypothetical protein